MPLTEVRLFQYLKTPAVFLLFLLSAPALLLALPAPMDNAELMEKSDLVALVRVLSVGCTSVTRDEQSGEELPGYLATLQVLEVKKGDVKAGDEVLVTCAPFRPASSDRGSSIITRARRSGRTSPSAAAA